MTHITLLKTSELLSQRKVITLSAKMWLIDCKLGLLSLILPIAIICTNYRGTTGNLELNFKVKRRLRGMLPPTFRVHRKRHSKQIISSIIQKVSKCYLRYKQETNKIRIFFFRYLFFCVIFPKHFPNEFSKYLQINSTFVLEWLMIICGKMFLWQWRAFFHHPRALLAPSIK